MTNQEHREKINKAAQALADAVNDAITNGMIINVNFEIISPIGGHEKVIPVVSCNPSIDDILFSDESIGCESCGYYSMSRGCERGVSVHGRNTDNDFKCKLWSIKK